MEELIKEAEMLYKRINDIQLSLIRSRINNDGEGNRTAISEMEIAMCNAFLFLKCILERRDYIVDLGEVWHTLDLNASVPDSNIAYLDIIAIVDNDIICDINTLSGLYEWLRYNSVIQGQIKWAFWKDLLPKGDNK